MMLSVPFSLSVYLQLVKIDAHVDINNLCFVFVCVIQLYRPLCFIFFMEDK